MNQLFDDKLLKETFLQVAQPILIDDTIHQATITNAEIRDRDVKYINSLQPIFSGQYVTLNDEKFLIVSETEVKRHFKYRAKMQHCNIVLPQLTYLVGREVVGTDSTGKPIYKDVYSNPVDIYAVSKELSLGLGGNVAIQVDTSNFVLKVADNTATRTILAVNNTFTYDDYTYKVKSIATPIRGVLEVYTERVT